MGDHRASIKIEMEAHDKIYRKEWWINWSPEDRDGCDRRITDWFAACWADAYARYDTEVYESQREEREQAKEKADRAMLATLKARYES